MFSFGLTLKSALVKSIESQLFTSSLYYLSYCTIFIHLLNPLYQICRKLQPIFSPLGIYWGSLNESPNIRAITACSEWHTALHSV